MLRTSLSILLLHTASAVCSYLPPAPVGVKTLPASKSDGSYVSYKEPGICETTPNVKSYSGYVHTPNAEGPNTYDAHTFFWFFEARSDPKNAPLVVYFAGGPGESSMVAAINENGPCQVQRDMNSTVLNPTSWTNTVNVLYVDQPSFSGFSYDVLTNGTVDLTSGTIAPADFSNGVPAGNNTVLPGIFPSQQFNATPNTTEAGARVMWKFMQTWLSDFPQHHAKNREISMWGNSYGGYFVPGYASYFIARSEALRNGSTTDCDEKPIKISKAGITNGCIDFGVAGPSYTEIAVNNTYGIKFVNDTVDQQALDYYTSPGGPADLFEQCNGVLKEAPVGTLNTNPVLNEICVNASTAGYLGYQKAISSASKYNQFDIAQLNPATYPPPYDSGFLNRAWVQQALGVPLNYTASATVVTANFFARTGDPARQGIEQLNYILSHGVDVTMVYGDRDYQCNWIGAEKTSLVAEWPGKDDFSKAGYAPLTTNNTYQGGFVRQVAGLSFSRVFEAGHTVDAYQPSTVYEIFTRAMSGRDIATGTQKISSGQKAQHPHWRHNNATSSTYSTVGPLSVRNVTNEVPQSKTLECNIWAIYSSCTQEQIAALVNGTAKVDNYVVVEPAWVEGA